MMIGMRRVNGSKTGCRHLTSHHNPGLPFCGSVFRDDAVKPKKTEIFCETRFSLNKEQTIFTRQSDS